MISYRSLSLLSYIHKHETWSPSFTRYLLKILSERIPKNDLIINILLVKIWKAQLTIFNLFLYFFYFLLLKYSNLIPLGADEAPSPPRGRTCSSSTSSLVVHRLTDIHHFFVKSSHGILDFLGRSTSNLVFKHL